MTSNQHGPYARGYTRVTMAGTAGSDLVTGSESRKPVLVRIGVCNWRGEYVPGPCTHRPSSHGSRGCLKSVTARGGLGQNW